MDLFEENKPAFYLPTVSNASALFTAILWKVAALPLDSSELGLKQTMAA